CPATRSVVFCRHSTRSDLFALSAQGCQYVVRYLKVSRSATIDHLAKYLMMRTEEQMLREQQSCSKTTTPTTTTPPPHRLTDETDERVHYNFLVKHSKGRF